MELELKEGIGEIRLDSLTPTQQANFRKFLDAVRFPHWFVDNTKLRFDYYEVAKAAGVVTTEITVEVYQGIVSDVKGLPKGWTYKVNDEDGEHYE